MNQAYQTPPAPPEPIVEDPPEPMDTTEPPYTPFFPQTQYTPPSSCPGSILMNIILLSGKLLLLASWVFLKQWWNNLGAYRQQQVVDVQTLDQFIGFLLKEFVGETQNRVDQLRDEFFKLKCCSFDPKDLQLHFKRASLRFYEIGGPDDPNIKQAYLSSIPDSLSQETQRLIEQNGLTLASITFGHLGQLIDKALHGLCNKWNFINQFQQRLPNATLLGVLEAVIACFMGILKQWWNNLGAYRQQQVVDVQTLDQFIGFLLKEFVGETQNRVDQLRDEFFKLKCCSFDPKDLQLHFKRASLRFYEIGGPDDPNIKQAYLSSIPDSLSQETQRLIEQNGLTLASITFGHLGQLIDKALHGLCNKWNFINQFQQTGQRIEKSCQRPDLILKCSNKDATCHCPTKKKRHFRRYKQSSWFQKDKKPFHKKGPKGSKFRFRKKKNGLISKRNSLALLRLNAVIS
ncbi:hypothetical protein Patl1_15626 [Pistacia atlantica]|uniref:Uncharacterized protein n=1 Tax=Pistacia atlantica TaxID=434234 RepID=A0ACC1BAV4_9ROSI|nr:hypothetical protein Patl1_15626 [Pistacia atlantica]